MPSEFEKTLFAELRKSIPDLVAERRLEGHGKEWVANLYSESEGLVIEACSRNVVRTGKSHSSIQHIEKFHSMLLKLIDMKTHDPKLRGIMIWQNLVPAYSTDLGMATRWGIYVLSGKDLRIREILDDSPPSKSNKATLPFLIRRSDDATPRWRWLAREREAMIVSLLQKEAMGVRQICEAVGMDYGPRRTEACKLLRALQEEGKVRRLMPGYVRGHGAIYGTRESQLAEIEKKLFAGYRRHKRNQRLAERIKDLLTEAGPMNYKEIISGLSERWGLQVDRNVLVSILNKRLRAKNIVRVTGIPKHLVYSIT